MSIRLCLYIEGKNIADITGVWIFNDPPESGRMIELSAYYSNCGFFSPRQDFFVLKSRLGNRIFRYLFFELKWIIRSIKEVREGGKPLLVISLESLQEIESACKEKRSKV